MPEAEKKYHRITNVSSGARVINTGGGQMMLDPGASHIGTFAEADLARMQGRADYTVTEVSGADLEAERKAGRVPGERAEGEAPAGAVRVSEEPGAARRYGEAIRSPTNPSGAPAPMPSTGAAAKNQPEPAAGAAATGGGEQPAGGGEAGRRAGADTGGTGTAGRARDRR